MSAKSDYVLVQRSPGQKNTCLQRYNLAIIILSGIVIALSLALIIVFLAVNASRGSIQRNCVDATQRFTASNSTGNVIGSLLTDVNERTIQWEFQYQGLTSPVIGIQIRGPIAPGMTSGPLAQPLCGAPGTLLCDLSTANVLQGEIDETNPSQQSLRPVIQAIREMPYAYYVDFCTTLFDCTGNMGGEVRGALNVLCSTSVD